MNSKLNRRDFIANSTKLGIAFCSFMIGSKLHAMDHPFALTDDEIDPKKLNYCGYKCPEDCKFLKASLENDVELKKEAYKSWQIKERYGVEFEADKIFCYGCKNKEKPEGVVLVNCTVRSCAMEKEFDCCIECNELEKCNKDLWTRFPDFAKKVIEMQKKYNKNKNND
jgi:hypothetical protein